MIAVYKIENQHTKDFYIGSSAHVKQRWLEHLHALRHSKHHSPILQNSWNKHGEDAFVFSIVKKVNDIEMLVETEQYYISIFNPRYNVSKVAGSPLGVKHTEQSRKNMSEAHKGHNLKGHKPDCECCICMRPVGKNSYRYKPREIRSCACGCNNTFGCMTDSKKRFINGHNGRGERLPKTKEQIEKHRGSLLRYYKNKEVNYE